jgi:dTDP-glucose 4,6-dehydratase
MTTIGQLETEDSEIFETLSEYGKAKYETELLFRDNFEPNEFEVSNPRLFTFYGPGIPLDKHFAIGNFLRNAMNKEPIVVNGNPDTVRSYMHPIDLVIWIIKLLLNPSTSTLNFGSDAPITMANLASRINEITGNKGIEFIGKSEPVSVYFPSTIKARGHLKVKQSIKFEEGIERWISWLNTQS